MQDTTYHLADNLILFQWNQLTTPYTFLLYKSTRASTLQKSLQQQAKPVARLNLT